MRSAFRPLVLLACLCAAPAAARAGWVAQWVNTAVKSNGDRLDPESSTMRIAKGKIKVEQPNTTTLIDYGKGTFTILNPQKQYFWTGSVDDYIEEMTRERNVALKRRMGKDTDPLKSDLSKVDSAKLPKTAIEKTEETKEIAGHPTTKYIVRADGEVFQEIWVAAGLDVTRDIDLDKYLEYERKMSAFMLGKSGRIFTSLYRNEDYRKLLQGGFVLQSTTRHIAGGYEQVATDFKESDVAPAEFEVPDSYRRVRLADVLTDKQQG